ncbi:SAYSvFN domain-containing protein 1 [Neocloeon triangulifer]|uniref:SAYSvFN domain-containing protein 1 n=1 Tax=Neocloeon triangulifer TaxID=2078957 RepID=UPI00286EEB1B|nr:SAYSvFN domain-containing protein 1 [Neocloeon triangulifer]
MDAKLREYRAKRRRQELIDEAKSKVKNFFAAGVKEKDESDMDPALSAHEREPMLSAAAPSASFPSGQRNVVLMSDDEAWEAEEDESSTEGLLSKRIRRTTTAILALLWLTLLLISHQLGLALAFCVISAIVFIFLCTKTTPRKPGEPSAYSVFNPNCESIDGTLKAEQFEREIRYGPGGVH